MSITSDLRGYADTALEQGKHVGAKASSTVADLRAQAEKAINIDAIKAAVEPYLAQAKEYRTAVTDRANGLVGSVTSDKRLAKLVDTAESLSGTVVGTVQDRVVKPVQNLTGLGKPARPAAKTTPATKPASTRPAPKPAAKATAKTTARKAPAKKAKA
jgi:osmotically-inducible protein OsmY